MSSEGKPSVSIDATAEQSRTGGGFSGEPSFTLESSLDFLVGMTAMVSGDANQRELAARLFEQILGSKPSDEAEMSGMFGQSFLCAFSAAMRSMATMRGTFVLGTKYLQEQAERRTAYLDHLAGLTALNKDAVIWRIVGIAGGSSAMVSLHNAPAAVRALVLTAVLGAALGYVVTDVLVKWYAYRAKRKLSKDTELAIRDHWGALARPAFRLTLLWFARRYLAITEQTAPNDLDRLIDERLDLLPSSNLGADIFERL